MESIMLHGTTKGKNNEVVGLYLIDVMFIFLI